ncbi:hypothetical protein [Gordonibacter urolithinfaciens]|uniref:hypothetical protein n=1 Tax=Gordonibacter urolithinfaciens TaxID=1335613 RepID=UPI003AAA79B0
MLDQRINDRGVGVDARLAASARAMAEADARESKRRLASLTGLANPNSHAQLLGWLQGRGCPIEGCGREVLEAEAAREGCDPLAREAIELRRHLHLAVHVARAVGHEALPVPAFEGHGLGRRLAELVDQPGADFRVLLFGYSWGGEPARVVDLTREELPLGLAAALADPRAVKHAFNANFERVCLSRLLGMPEGTYLPAASFCASTLRNAPRTCRRPPMAGRPSCASRCRWTGA